MANEKAKVLIVEDDWMLLNIYATTFEREGFDVLTAGNGEDGFELIKNEKPEVILLDIMLPGEKSGLEVLAEVKKIKSLKRIPVVILSNLEDDKTISEGLKLGASGYFIKTQTTPNDVVQSIQALVK